MDLAVVSGSALYSMVTWIRLFLGCGLVIPPGMERSGQCHTFTQEEVEMMKWKQSYWVRAAQPYSWRFTV